MIGCQNLHFYIRMSFHFRKNGISYCVWKVYGLAYFLSNVNSELLVSIQLDEIIILIFQCLLDDIEV